MESGFVPLFHLADVAAPFASSLTLHPERQASATVHAVMTTSPRACRLTGPTVDLSATRAWTPPPAPETCGATEVAAYAAGTLKSAFGSGASERPARVFVIASSQFAANPLARAGNGPELGAMGMAMPSMGGDEQTLLLAGPYAQRVLTSTILVFKNTLDWMVLEDGLAECALPH
jgi:hypothetical protein